MRRLMEGRLSEAEELAAEAMAIGEAAGSDNAWLLGTVLRAVAAAQRFDTKAAMAFLTTMGHVPEAAPPGSVVDPAAVFVPEANPAGTRRELDRLAAGAFDEIPFDFSRRRMSVILDYEGDHHRNPVRFNKDIRRHDNVMELGWMDIRVTSRDTEGGIIGRLTTEWSRRT